MNTFINVRLNITFDDWQDRCRIYPRNTFKQPVCFSEALPNWLIPFAPPKSLTQISKENVRLFCSSGVICHAKRLSFTSGDVLCRLCHTDLLSADSPLLSTQLLPVQFIPSLLSFHAHLCYFFFYLCWELQCSSSHPDSSGFHTRQVRIRFFHSFYSVIRDIFSERNYLYLEVCWCLECQEHSQGHLCQSVRYGWD